MPVKAPEDTKKKSEQRNLKGEPSLRDVELESKMNTTYHLRAKSFEMRVTASKLASISAKDDPLARRKALAKRVHAKPEAEVIEDGDKKRETDLLVAKAEAINPRGKYD